MWELEFDEEDFGFKVIEFKDTICINDSCLLNQPFYTAYELTGKFPRDIDGIMGVGTKQSEEYSLIKQAVKEGLIHRAMIGLYLTEDGGEITFGDYSSDKVQGGDDSMLWINIPDLSKWAIEITEAKFGDLSIFHHSFKEAIINPGQKDIGFVDTDFIKLSNYLSQNLGFDCEDQCFSIHDCSNIDLSSHTLEMYLDEHTQTLNMKGSKLLSSVTEENEEGYKCRFNAFDSGNKMVLGNTFL